MRLPRLKRVALPTVYHCVSHLVEEASHLTPAEKEFFTKRMRALARFCTMPIIEHSVMGNHFHIITRSPGPIDLTDEQLLQRLIDYYGNKSTQVIAFRDVMNGRTQRRTQLREAYLRRMGDVSVFMKELKEGFTRWYNRRHGRRGTLWSARFGSELVEDQPSVLRIVSAYVALNSVRAGLTDDPGKYRFCGYAAALAGDKEARAGLQSFLRPGSWTRQAREYRELLFGTAGRSSHSSKQLLSPSTIAKALNASGAQELSMMLRCRVRYFTDGTVLGAAEFVEQIWQQHLKKHNPKRRSGARRLRGKVWGGLCSLRDLRKNVFRLTE